MNFQCPDCGLENAYFVLVDEEGSHYECPDCDYEWCDTSIGLEEEEDETEF